MRTLQLVQTGRQEDSYSEDGCSEDWCSEDWCSKDRMSAVVLEGEVATLRVVLSPTVLLDR